MFTLQNDDYSLHVLGKATLGQQCGAIDLHGWLAAQIRQVPQL